MKTEDFKYRGMNIHVATDGSGSLAQARDPQHLDPYGRGELIAAEPMSTSASCSPAKAESIAIETVLEKVDGYLDDSVS